ncbi:helix-turn-helix transcriptional regulator [Ottowia thiooxydans]|uniref:helix-turn-helix transcriptional regulator n=1 Tax=Ottowia thiooxydans TaxID=219182 RepID=UPI00040EE831|nr:helix-turn-helix transcriptional regulator [Ottowia thiooxydans]
MGAPPSDQSPTQRLSCPPIHDLSRLKAFQEQFEAFLGGIHVEPLNGSPLAIEGTVTRFEQVSIQIGEASPSRCTHPASMVPDDSVLLMGIYEGSGSISVRGSECRLGGGDMVFAGSHHPESVVTYIPTHLCQVTLNRSMLSSMQVDVDSAMLQPLRGHPVVSMLMRYAYMLRDHDDLTTPELRRAATVHLHDLAALAAGATGDVAHIAQGRGARAARLLAIKRDITAHFTDGALSVGAVARRHGITPRYLHMLLAQEGLSFSSLVMEQRLALVYRRLVDPRLSGCAIQTLAFDAGFGDLSYFNRNFRERYGMTPSEARAGEFL